MDGSTLSLEGRLRLRVDDVICRQCNVQATNALDHVCGLCRAIGKRAGGDETPEDLRSDLLNAAVCAKRFILGFRT